MALGKSINPVATYRILYQLLQLVVDDMIWWWKFFQSFHLALWSTQINQRISAIL